MVKSLTYWKVHEQIKSGKLSPVYLFAGEEIFLKREIEDLIHSSVFKNSASDLNCNIFYGEDCSLDNVIDTLKTQPFGEGKRLVLLRNVEKLYQHEKKLVEFLRVSVSSAIFIMETEKHPSDKFIKKIAEFCTVVDFCELKEKELHNWINNFAHKHGKRISYAGITSLLEKLGYELDEVVNALNKLFLYAADKKEISEHDIKLLIKKTREDTRFAFLNALMRRQIGLSLSMANELSRNGKNAADLIGLINWQLKRLENVKRLSQTGMSKGEIIRTLKMTPYVFDIVNKQAEKFSMLEIERNFRLLLESDVAIKQGSKSPGLALETLIVDLCARK